LQVHASLARMKRLSVAFFITLLLPPLGGPALTQPVVTQPPTSTIIFTPGSTVSTVNGQMAPGAHDLYYVQAKVGQTLLVSITSEGDIAFQVYTADTTLAKGADGGPLINGKTRANAGVTDHTKAWVGAVARTGNYLIAVGAGNGGPTGPMPYGLTVSLQ
jgi:ABC-type sugar transport system substrate-binding protein